MCWKNGANRLIAITGGIGSGKSVVSQVLRVLGYAVYDCDSRAKQIMDSDPLIKSQLSNRFGAEVVIDDCIDRRLLAKIVFADSEALEALNSIVHRAVLDDVAHWVTQQSGLCFVETAILYQSGLDRYVDEVWEVIAPKEIRLLRAMARDGASQEQIASRMDSQDAFVPVSRHSVVREIVNDGDMPLLPQIISNLSASK